MIFNCIAKWYHHHLFFEIQHFTLKNLVNKSISNKAALLPPIIWVSINLDLINMSELHPQGHVQVGQIHQNTQLILLIKCSSWWIIILALLTKFNGKSTVTVYPKKYAHSFCFAVLCCGYTLTDFPISIRLTSLALWQSNDCPSASKATLMNMDKYFMWIHYEWLHNHNKAKHNKTVCIFLGIYCSWLLYGFWFVQLHVLASVRIS